MQLTCPGCKKKFSLPETAAGKNVRCRNCKWVIAVPGHGEIKVPPPGVRAGHVAPGARPPAADATPARPPRRGFWIAVILAGLLIAGAALFGIVYVLRAM